MAESQNKKVARLAVVKARAAVRTRRRMADFAEEQAVEAELAKQAEQDAKVEAKRENQLADAREAEVGTENAPAPAKPASKSTAKKETK